MVTTSQDRAKKRKRELEEDKQRRKENNQKRQETFGPRKNLALGSRENQLRQGLGIRDQATGDLQPFKTGEVSAKEFNEAKSQSEILSKGGRRVPRDVGLEERRRVAKFLGVNVEDLNDIPNLDIGRLLDSGAIPTEQGFDNNLQSPLPGDVQSVLPPEQDTGNLLFGPPGDRSDPISQFIFKQPGDLPFNDQIRNLLFKDGQPATGEGLGVLNDIGEEPGTALITAGALGLGASGLIRGTVATGSLSTVTSANAGRAFGASETAFNTAKTNVGGLSLKSTKTLLQGGAALAGTDAMMAWLASDNILSGQGIYVRDIANAVKFDGLDPREALKLIEEAEEISTLAENYLNTSTSVNPLLMPYKNLILANVAQSKLQREFHKQEILKQAFSGL